MSEVMLENCARDDVRLRPLLQEYLREWSALLPVPIAADGSFVYRELDEVDRLLLLVDAAALGFAFTSCDERGWMHVEEIFIAPPARRSGWGVRALQALFACAPDATWTWTVRPENPKGLVFWQRACRRATTTSEVGGDGITRTRFTLVVAPHTAR